MTTLFVLGIIVGWIVIGSIVTRVTWIYDIWDFRILDRFSLGVVLLMWPVQIFILCAYAIHWFVTRPVKRDSR